MRIRKYDFDYGRRVLMEKMARGISTAGVLAPMWPLIGETADIGKAYPEELLHIEAYTKGKIKVGDVLTEVNVDVVKDMLDPITFQEVKTMGRRINIVQTTRDVTKLFPRRYLMATLRNKGRAREDGDGNTWTDGQVGTPWIGGMPYPEPKNGLQAQANLTLSWGRHDYTQYPILLACLDSHGDIDYTYDLVWAELQVTGRPDGSIFQGRKDLTRYQSVWFTYPEDCAGSSFLNVWYYDQRKFPDLYGYLPAFKRVRQFPTNQRFEPLVPGMSFFLSDAWAAGDPLLTWGNYKIVGRQPFLGAMGSANYMGGRPHWDRPLHGGPKGKTFYDTWFELIPECIVIEAETTGYPRSPVSKKRVYIDARNGVYTTAITFDRRGDLWKSNEPGFCQYSNDKYTQKDQDGYADWSWCYCHAHDIQVNRMTRFLHAHDCAGGYVEKLSTQGEDVYNKYMTIQAISRLGQA